MRSGFATTRWSVVRDAALPADQRMHALSEIYTSYWKPICEYVRRLGVVQGEVEDAAQDFFLAFFNSNAFQNADAERGRFRVFLQGALRHHVYKRLRKANALKRGGGSTVVSMETLEEELQNTFQDDDTRLFDREWAQAVVGNAWTRFEAGKDAGEMDSKQLQAWLFGEDQPLQRETAQRLGITVTALKARIFRMRRRFREILKDEVGRTVSHEADADDELAYISQILGSSWS